MMKKISILLSILCTISTHTQASEELISPELDAFMELKPLDPKVFEGNLYVGLIGFYLPQESFIEITEEFFIKNDEIGLKRIQEGHLVKDPLKRDILQTSLQIMAQPDSMESLLAYNNGLLKLESFIPKDLSFLKVKVEPYGDEKLPQTESYFPCIQYANNDCLETTAKHKDYIEQTIQNNKVFLERFEWLIQNSTHNATIIPSGAGIIEILPGYQGINAAYFLNLSDAILKIQAKKTDEGLKKLVLARKWLDLNYQPTSNPLLIDLMISIVHKQYLDQTISTLLDSGLLEDYIYSPELQFVVSPYSSRSGLTVQKAMIFEYKYDFFSKYAPYIKVFNKHPNNIHLSQEDQYILLDYIQNQSMTLSPKLEILFTSLELTKQFGLWQKAKERDELKEALEKASSAQLTANFENLREFFGYDAEKKHNNTKLEALKKELIESTQALNNWYDNYYSSLGVSIKDGISYLNTEHPSTEFFNAHLSMLNRLDTMNNNEQLFNYAMIEKMLNEDFLHTITLQFVFPQNDDYTMRLNEQQNYHQLVYLKYLVLRDKIPTDKIPAFLESQGDLAKNTITKEPYHFDAKTRILSTPLPKERKYLPISIRTAQDKDKLIQDFKVEIPQV